MGNGHAESNLSFFVVVVVLLSSVHLTACTSSVESLKGHPQQRRPDIVELRHNIITGLKLEKLPDMAKADISNDEFHCKYLEYFRRLYMDDENDDVMTGLIAGYDNDVSAIQIQGQVKPALAGAKKEKVHWKLRHSEDAAVIKAVVRIYGKQDEHDTIQTPIKIQTSSRLRRVFNGPANTVAHTVWLLRVGEDRWQDVDVTELLRERRERKNSTLELSVHINGSVSFDHRQPILHVFLNGVDPDELVGEDALETICAGNPERRKKRKKRDGDEVKRPLQTTFPSDGGGGGRRRRTDCKPPMVDDKSAAGNRSSNLTEHNKCCREEMRVVFADIPGFDFIIEPKWFDAGLCRGRCPAKYNPATRHAFIQSLLWKQHNTTKRQQQQQPQQQQNDQSQKSGRHKMRHGGKRDGGEIPSPPPPPKPCCAPSKLDRLQIIHVDELNPSALKVTTWKEMAVVECACS
ncbi:bone morphogenetic protein 8A isoform X2 [Daktulosphaira vitifoliae]|uniref:bone morphogenetic protein 8A isoform X2 n=1 Tax=Daktulosphaira vitifoliae TaxID=58002 RepID=UPI0021AA1673|nr:bone morphogenetic protein 8A isoform X2 [Daktulosphaira vitifoliae]